MADKRISQLIERTDIANNDVLPIVASGATTTNKVTISTIQDWMQDNLDVGVTSVGITLGSSGTDVNVTGSPITTSGNITINIPTASATNRGLLSAADWSTFNGKQNSITLTTSGTSGAATLVGSTLNIPNYSTGVANAYVPYVGAIGSVTLGYNSLSASQINIDGASPTGGSYLGFKHSTSVNTGTDGYTSMYTFGTNTIAFKSVSGGNSKDFSFSMVGITPNVAGGRQYTLPDASGTLALTSDLSGYVTIGTTQTITGSKTFNSRIIGQDATLTGSGSADTLEVAHTSGSGIAVDISKAGDGEGLRVIKTSGSGNAVTISGGLLSAEAATFSGALNGTSASFSGRLLAGTSTGVGNDFTSIRFNSADTFSQGMNMVDSNASASGSTFQVFRKSDDTYVGNIRRSGTDNAIFIGGNSYLALGANNTEFFRIASTGAATFSSSVTAASLSGAFATLSNYGSATSTALQLGDANNGLFRPALNSVAIATNGAAALTLASTGAATFSSSVTATQGVFKSTSGNQLRIAFNDSFYWNVERVAVDGRLSFSDSNNGEKLVLTTSGNVGIGTASPNSKLHIISSLGTKALSIGESGNNERLIIGQESGYAANYIDSTNVNLKFSTYLDGGTGGNIRFFTGVGSASERMRISHDGAVGFNSNSAEGNAGLDKISIGHLSGSYGWIQTWNATSMYLNRLGNAVYAGTQRIDNNSDERIKENISPIDNALTTVLSLQGKKFNMLDEDDVLRYGFIAQEVQPHLPDFVTESERTFEKDDVKIENLLTLENSGAAWAAILVEAIKEQQEQIKSLTEQVEALKSQING